MSRRKVGVQKRAHTEMRELPVKLTPEELKGISRGMADTIGEIEELEAQKKVTVGDFNSRIKAHKQHNRDLAKKHRTGEELRMVEVEIKYDFGNDVVRYIRTDTDEEIDSRPMDAFDRQENMNYEGDALPPPASPQPRRGRRKKSEEQPAEEPAPEQEQEQSEQTASEPEEQEQGAEVITIAERRKREKNRA